MTELPISRTYIDDQQVEISFYEWPVAKPKAVIQIAHGLGEHARRYDEVAAVLNRAGYSVYADDHRGHGATGSQMVIDKTTEKLGRLGPGGMRATVNQVAKLTSIIKAENKGLPIIMYGHSWGSFLTQRMSYEQLSRFSALIISGSGSLAPGATKAGNFNAPWDVAGATGFEWLSRDPKVWDDFIADERNFLAVPIESFGIKGALYLFGGLPQTLPQIPVVILLGSEDPVGGPKSNKRLAKQFTRRGIEDLELWIYDNGRHEMHNETNKQQFFDDLTQWLDKRFN